MKRTKYFYMLMAALVAIGSLLLVGCSKDDDNNNDDTTKDSGKSSFESNVKGKVTALYGSSTTKDYYSYTTRWESGHTEVIGTDDGSILANLKDGATFEATLSENEPSDYLYEYPAGHYYYPNDVRWTFMTDDEVKQGVELYIKTNNWELTGGSPTSYWCKECKGKVIVKSIEGSKITLEFKDFKFDRISAWHVGNSTKSDVVINGEITFDIETK